MANGESGARDSVYARICRELERAPGLPYAFQDLASAGRMEASFLLSGDQVPPPLRQRWAAGMAEAIVSSARAGEALPELRAELDGPPPMLYFGALIRRLLLLIDEGALDAEALYRFAAKLARESASLREVKLGMLLLAPFDNDISRRLMRTLALHSEFTLYGAEAAQSWRQGNQFLFDLAQNTAGRGKLIALCHFQPVDAQQRRWLFLHGMEGCAERTALAAACLAKPDLRRRFLAPAEDAAEFHALSRWVACGARSGAIPRAEGGAEIARSYLSQLGAFPPEWPDFAAAAMLLRSLRENPSAEDSPWRMEDRDQIWDVCAGFLDAHGKNSRRLQAAQAEAMERADEDAGLLLDVLEELHLRKLMEPPEFERFEAILDADPLGLDALEYLLLHHPERYAGDVHANLEFGQELFTGPQAMEEDSASPEYRVDLWLQYLLRAMRKQNLWDEALFLRCLGARWPGARREALTSLRAMKLDWSEAVKPALEAALESEPDEHLQKRIRRLLWNEGGKRGSEQRYVEVEGLGARPGELREPFLQTEIAGAFYRDLTVVQDRVGAGDSLLLVREGENPYDANAILVTAEDGYVLGYIPRQSNAELAARMDAGERFVAVLLDALDGGANRPRIEVQRVRQIEREGNVLRLPGAQWQSEGGGLALDLHGLRLRLRIDPPGAEGDGFAASGSVDGEFLLYDFDDVLILPEELEELVSSLGGLLNGAPEVEGKFVFEDPELEFCLLPAKLPGSQPVLELILRFWTANGPMNGSRISLVMERPEIEALLNYLRFVAGRA